jgi:acetylornithine/succinyldiaminopimelate/putrescine aminotransferase
MFSHRNIFLNSLAQTSPTPLSIEVVRAKGMYLIDIQGKRYIDMISGISASSLGHLHPKVVKAVQKQIKKYMHLMVYGEYVQHPQTQLAKKLADHLPQNLSCTYLVNSGSEAIEAALKLAKRATGRTKIVAFKNAYHGSTHGALSVMGDEYFKSAFRPLLPDIQHIEFNNMNDLQHIDSRTACVLAETIQGEAGAIVPDHLFLQTLRKKCNETGALFILDEIQAGCGRSGKLWAFEHFGIVPDILVLAKGLGGGMPIGAMISSKELMQLFTEKPVLGHITTFGGHPVSAAAAYATLKTILDEKLIESIQDKEYLIRELLQNQAIQSISGKGLLLSIEFESTELNMKIIKKCIENGVITDWFLFNDKRMRIAPPLNIDFKEIKKACSILQKSIHECS